MPQTRSVSAAASAIYCVDTSSFVYCNRSFGARESRLKLYQPIWTLLDTLADEGRIQAPHLVKVEITKNQDDIGKWAVGHPGVFRPKGEYATLVTAILREPGQQLVDPTAPRGSEEADPWVIALAEGISATPPTLWEAKVGIVVSEEAKAGGIRDISIRRGLQHLDFTGMLVAEGISIGGP